MRIAVMAALLLLALCPLAVAAETPDAVQAEQTASVKVELYSTSWCGYCKMARKYFTTKKIPFVEYDIEKDQDAYVRFRKYNPQGGVPFAVIGKYGVPGYSEQGYQQALELSLTQPPQPPAQQTPSKTDAPQPSK